MAQITLEVCTYSPECQAGHLDREPLQRRTARAYGLFEHRTRSRRKQSLDLMRYNRPERKQTAHD
jgi:hypothetical protein